MLANELKEEKEYNIKMSKRYAIIKNYDKAWAYKIIGEIYETCEEKLKEVIKA